MNYTAVFLFLGVGAFWISVVHARIEFDLYKNSRAKRDVSDDNKWKNDSVELFKFMDNEYYGLIGVGSPSKTFKFLFDTTWADVWLPSAHCPLTDIVCHLHTRYDSSASSSYKEDGRMENLTTKDFSLVGFLSTDTFHLSHIKLENQTFMEVTHFSLLPFVQTKADGVIGLALKSASNWPDKDSFFFNLVNQNLMKEKVFTFYMNRDQTTEKAGKVIFGGRDRTHVKEETLKEITVTDASMWQIEIDSIELESNKKLRTVCEKCPAIFDSSSNVISGPPDIIQKINYMLQGRYIPGLNKYSVNCRQYARLPKIHFKLDGYDYIIQSKYYIQRFSVHSIEACFSPFVSNGEPGNPLWELGGAFMMEFYTEFDVENRVITIGETIF